MSIQLKTLGRARPHFFKSTHAIVCRSCRPIIISASLNRQLEIFERLYDKGPQKSIIPQTTLMDLNHGKSHEFFMGLKNFVRFVDFLHKLVHCFDLNKCMSDLNLSNFSRLAGPKILRAVLVS